MLKKYKRGIVSVFLLIMFIGYYLITDPDADILSNLPFGSDLLITLQIFIIAIIGIVIVEFVPDAFIASTYDKEPKILERATMEANSSGLVLVAKSIRILAYSIMIGASIIAFTH